MRQEALPVVLRGIHVNYGGFSALGGIDLEIQSGSRRAIIGPNGAGKTTLINVIGGNIRPSRGNVSLFGDDVTHMPAFRRARLGLARTHQITTLFNGLTVFDNVRLAVQGRLSMRWVMYRPSERYSDVDDRCFELLEMVSLEDRAAEPVGDLSHGEQRQLELALAMASEPRLLLLDEPAAGLAPAERDMLMELIADAGRETTLILVEHNMEVVLSLAERITVLSSGKIVSDGTPAEIQRDETVRRLYLGGE